MAIAVAAVVPFSATIVDDLDVGVLYLLAVGAIGVLPVFAAGWGEQQQVRPARRDARDRAVGLVRSAAGARPRWCP